MARSRFHLGLLTRARCRFWFYIIIWIRNSNGRNDKVGDTTAGLFRSTRHTKIHIKGKVHL